MSLGSFGKADDFVWLYCEVQTCGKTLVRKGWKPGLPADQPPVWVFCPLMHHQIPRDRVLILLCEKCEHYKGASHDVGEALRRTGGISWIPRKKFTEEQLQQALHEDEERKREWLAEEDARKQRDPRK